jgi:hypothetical protein
MAEGWSPVLRVSELNGRCRLSLVGYAHGDGETLQDAAEDLVRKVVVLAQGVRAGRATMVVRELGPSDFRWLELLYEIGEIARVDGDVRARLLGVRAA